jgi:hypothetical protein
MNGHHIARRTLIRGAGLGIGANLSAGLLSGLAPARAENAGPAAELWSQEYWAQMGGCWARGQYSTAIEELGRRLTTGRIY